MDLENQIVFYSAFPLAFYIFSSFAQIRHESKALSYLFSIRGMEFVTISLSILSTVCIWFCMREGKNETIKKDNTEAAAASIKNLN